MSTVFRTTAVGLQSRRILLGRPLHKVYVPLRTVASSVSNRPASQSFPQAALNIKEESSNAASEVAKVIAGASGGGGSFFMITKDMAAEVPRSALIFGLIGGLPYAGASLTTVYLARQAGFAVDTTTSGIDPGTALTILDQALNIQVTYGAMMLSFLGALHWGMEFAAYGGQKGYKRLLLGAAPLLIAWPSLTFQPMEALALQWAGFTGLWLVDSKVTLHGWAPKWYSQYRFYLSILAGTCIIGSLAGCSYYGPVAGHGFISRDLELIQEERRKVQAMRAVHTGAIEAVSGGEDEDHYVRIRKKQDPEENQEEQQTGDAQAK